MRTFLLILGIGLLGALLLLGAHHRAESVRTAYRIRDLGDRLASLRNENAWLRAEIERRRTPQALERVAVKLGVDLPVKDTPLIAVRPHRGGETPGQ